MKKTFLLVSLVLSSTLIIGCNTVSGIGKDVSQGGQAIERAAR